MKNKILLLVGIVAILGASFVFAGGGDGSTTAATVNTTTASVYTNAATVTLLAANPKRIGVKIINEAGATNVTVGFASTLVYGKGYADVAPAGSLTFDTVSGPSCPQTEIYAITGGAVTNTIRIIEFVK